LSFTVSGKKIVKSIQERILGLKALLKDTIKSHYPHKQVPSHIQFDHEKHQKFYLNQVERLNKQGLGPWVTRTKTTLLIKLLNFQNKSVGMQIEVPKLCELPNLMTNFNQLVMQEFKITKIFVCFDLPLSSLNRLQAESIHDLDNYLMAKSLQSSLQKTTGQGSELTS